MTTFRTKIYHLISLTRRRRASILKNTKILAVILIALGLLHGYAAAQVAADQPDRTVLPPAAAPFKGKIEDYLMNSKQAWPSRSRRRKVRPTCCSSLATMSASAS